MTFTALAVLVLLLVVLAAVTLGKTKWGRLEGDDLEKRGEPRDKGRVSGGDD